MYLCSGLSLLFLTAAQAAPVENSYAIADLDLLTLPPPDLNFGARVSPITPGYLLTNNIFTITPLDFLAVSGKSGSIGPFMDYDLSGTECPKEHRIEELGDNTVSCCDGKCEICDDESACGPVDICPLTYLNNRVYGYVVCPPGMGVCFKFSVPDTKGAQEAIDKLPRQRQ
ncbi:hypothetical protein MMC07_005633 [Pseudocyphellaria aurata]|nr:hypothetical protein [Pseudocyphellaria aurata]